MSTRAYSSDVRKLVINHIETGSSQASVVRIFKVSKSAVSRWWIRYKKEDAKIAKPKLGSKGEVDVEFLKNYVVANPDDNLIEIGKKFNVSSCAIFKKLKKLGFSYKRKPLPMWRQMRENVQNTKN